MKKHDIGLEDSQLKLPFLYWIPKMHKNPSKQRYIAASHSCSTKPLSKKITYCLKLIQQTHINHCKTFEKIVAGIVCGLYNSMDVMQKLSTSRNLLRTLELMIFQLYIPVYLIGNLRIN